MAKIKFFNDTLHIISTLKTEEIKRRYDFGDKLVLKDHEQKEVFRLEHKEKATPTLTKFGCTYNGTTSDGYACLSIQFTEPLTKEKIVKKFGEAIRTLNYFEKIIKEDTSFERIIEETSNAIEEITFFNDTTEEVEEVEENTTNEDDTEQASNED